LGHQTNTRCEVSAGERKKCEEGLCCGAGLRPEVTAAAASVLVIETCQPTTTQYYYHEPTVGATKELWEFTCIEGAKYLTPALSLVAISSMLLFG